MPAVTTGMEIGTREAASRLSVVAVNYEGAHLVERLADAIWASGTPPLELIVVDNASSDDSVRRLAERADIMLLASERNLGFGQGCMLGAAHARGELLLFVNPDIEPIGDCLGTLARHHLSDPSVAISFPKVLARGERPEPMNWREDVATAGGAALLTSAAHLRCIGGFDPRIFLYYEETDLCWRTRLTGGRVVQDWEAWITHDDHGLGGGDRWAAEQIRNGLLVHIRLRSLRGVVRFVFWALVKSAVRGLQYRETDIVEPWLTTMRRLPGLLVERRRLRGASSPVNRARLELMCRENDFWRRHARRRALLSRLRPGTTRGT